jgi:TolB-like protein
MINKQMFIVPALWLAAAALLHATPPTVAVYDFRDTDSSGNFGEKVTALITADLADDTKLILLERSDLNKALNEQALGLSGMVNADTAAKIGEVTGAKVLVAGQVIQTDGNRLICIADIIGTETGRLFAAKVEGPADNLSRLTSDLSRQIAQTIKDQIANLEMPTEESHDARLKRIIKSIKGKNRPTVAVNITFVGGGSHPDDWADNEFEAVLMEAGFTVLDGQSDRKADIEIIGDCSGGNGPQRGDLITRIFAIEVKIRDRRTGALLGFDRQESAVTGIGSEGIVGRAAHVKGVDELAERVLPLLAK